MGRQKDKNMTSYVVSILVYLILCIGAVELLTIFAAFIKSAKFKDIYIFSVIVLICLVFVFLLIRLFSNETPKYKDGKYVWKDGRVYEGAWSKFFGANGKGKLTWADGSYYEGEFKNGNLCGKGKKVSLDGGSYVGDWKRNKANGKGKLTWADGSYYEGEFKNGSLCGKGKKVCPNGESYEGDWEDNHANGKGKSIGENGSYYEGEFKNGKPHGMGVMKMKNGYYYEGEFIDGKKAGKFKKQVLTTGGIIEGEFRDNGNNGFDGKGKVTSPDGFVFEGIFKDGKLSGGGKVILKNGEYSDGNWINGELYGLARYYFKDGSYYEGECKQGNWDGIGTYVTKKGDKYSTEFPYEIINIFMYGLNSKIKEIQGNLNYTAKSEKEKLEEKNMDLEILEKGTNIQKEIIKLSLNVDEKIGILYKSFNDNCDSSGSILEYHKNMLKLQKESRKSLKKIADKNHIKCSKSALYNSYGRYFYELDCLYTIGIEIAEFYVKFDKFLDSKNILDFVTKREEKNRERVVLIDEFSEKYKEYVQTCLDWREYEKKFWNYNFKPGKKKK